VDVEQLIFLDESGATTQMTRSYARAPRGQRVNEATPQGRWQILTLLAALTTRGLEAPMTIAEPTDGDIFLAYLEQVLCPRLRPGQVVILDNFIGPQSGGSARTDRGDRSPARLSAALFPRLQSHRTSLVEGQTNPALPEGAHCRGITKRGR